MYLDSNPIDMYASIAQWYRSGLVIQRELVRFPLASFHSSRIERFCRHYWFKAFTNCLYCLGLVRLFQNLLGDSLSP